MGVASAPPTRPASAAVALVVALGSRDVESQAINSLITHGLRVFRLAEVSLRGSSMLRTVAGMLSSKVISLLSIIRGILPFKTQRRIGEGSVAV